MNLFSRKWLRNLGFGGALFFGAKGLLWLAMLSTVGMRGCDP